VFDIGVVERNNCALSITATITIPMIVAVTAMITAMMAMMIAITPPFIRENTA